MLTSQLASAAGVPRASIRAEADNDSDTPEGRVRARALSATHPPSRSRRSAAKSARPSRGAAAHERRVALASSAFAKRLTRFLSRSFNATTAGRSPGHKERPPSCAPGGRAVIQIEAE